MDEIPQPSERYIARQGQKRHLAAAWAGLVGLRAGEAVLDIGSGPGFLAAEYARMVGPAGVVYAVDPGAALILAAPNLIGSRALALPQPPDVAFITDTLHHAADPAALLADVRAVCGPGTRLLVTEYDPVGPGLVGAKLPRRMPREGAARLVRDAGFTILSIADAPDEHYAVLASG